jgi:hypothetical protein
VGIVTPPQLNAYLGKPIGEICRNGYDNDADNHGAHFVSHAMSYGFGTTCLAMRRRGKQPGTTIWIHELFARCPTVGTWASRAATLTSCLVFIARPDHVNLATKVIAKVPTKHVGIHVSGVIWHYSNIERRVVQQTPDQFSHHYPSPDNAMFYGSLP